MYSYPKSYMSVEQLIQKLQGNGMEIASIEEANNAFNTIGYYRLKGYCYHRFDKNTNQYINGTKLSDVIKLYNFDTKLSHLIFEFISHIEIALRVHLVNAFQPTFNVVALNDPAFFNNKEFYWKNQANLASEIARSKDVFIIHNFDKHDGVIPVWAAVEIMSFGSLSKFIKNLKSGPNTVLSALIKNYKYQSPNGRLVTPSKDMFTSWIQSVSAMRNICAHNSRIYNRALTSIPKLIYTDYINPQPQFNGLYQVMLAMKYLRPSNEIWNDFIDKIKELLCNYSCVCELKRLNFPNDWEEHFKV